MTEFLEFMTCVHFRVPIGADGKLGDPQIVKRFTNPIKGAQHKKARKNVRTLSVQEASEELL